MQVNRINPSRLRTPADINEALDAISAELTRLQKLQEKVEARKDELVAAAVIKSLPDLADAQGSYEDFIAQLLSDAMAYREMQNAEPIKSEELENTVSDESESFVSSTDDKDDDDDVDSLFG